MVLFIVLLFMQEIESNERIRKQEMADKAETRRMEYQFKDKELEVRREKQRQDFEKLKMDVMKEWIQQYYPLEIKKIELVDKHRELAEPIATYSKMQYQHVQRMIGPARENWMLSYEEEEDTNEPRGQMLQLPYR